MGGAALAIHDIAAFHDMAPEPEDFLAAVLAGLSAGRRAIPGRFLLDGRGAMLLGRIRDLPEYYLARAERDILRRHARAIAARIGPAAQLVGIGGGAAVECDMLLAALDAPWGYVPIDDARERLLAAARRVQAGRPRLWVEAVCASFGQQFDLPPNAGGGRRVGFYPGSAIGNLDPADALAFLTALSERLRPGGLLLVGVDLRKSILILESAYDDAQGITAALTLNLLARANRELDADFDLRCFRHRVSYNADSGQVRMDLVSLAAQDVRIGGHVFHFADGEAIHVENSWKYSIGDFRALARGAGFRPLDAWVDDRELYSLHLLEVG